MSSQRLPTKLGKEPLIDAIFELRFDSTAPASHILPGVLFTALNGGVPFDIQQTNMAQLPEAVRRADETLKYLALVTLKWGSYTIYISDSSLALSCNLPYPGWSEFKSAITQVARAVLFINIIGVVERHSMKYVSVIQGDSLASQTKSLDWEIRLGSHKVQAEVATLRLEMHDERFVNLVSVQTGAVVRLVDGRTLTGAVVDVDTVAKATVSDPLHFLEKLSDSLDEMHQVNKAAFFGCLTSETVESLEPKYD